MAPHTHKSGSQPSLPSSPPVHHCTPLTRTPSGLTPQPCAQSWSVLLRICTEAHMHTHHITPSREYVNSVRVPACTSLASPNASHYAARRTPPPSKINRKRQHIHVIIACVTVRWPCGCLIRTTCHVYGLWISAGAPRPAEGRGVFDVSRIRITHTSSSPQALPGGRCNGPRGGCLTYHVSRLRIMYLAPRAPPSLPPPLRITHTHYALRSFHPS